MRDLFEAHARPEVVPGFLKDVRDFPSVQDVEIVSTKPGRLVGIAHSTNCDACSILVRSKCFLAGAVCRGSPAFEWNLIFRDVGHLRRLVHRLEGKGYPVKLTRVTEVKDAVPLTPRQERILSAALEFGYFSFPRRIRLAELAKRLEISKSWVSEVLRRAQTEVVEAYFRTQPSERDRRRP